MGARREQVLRAAMSLVVEHGAYGLTHRKVDAAAGVPAGTTSNHFPSTVALARALLQDISRTDAEFLREVGDLDESLGGEELMLAWLRRRVAFVLGPWRLHALAWYRFIAEGSADPEIRAEINEVRRQVFPDAEVVAKRCGSTDVPRDTRVLRTYVGAVLLMQHVEQVPADDLDRLLVRAVRGLAQTIGQRAGDDVGTP